MSKVYEEEEKKKHLELYKISSQTKTAYARENNIPEATFRAWVNEEKNQLFGAIDIEVPTIPTNKNLVKSIKIPTIFCSENIRIELKEGFDKNFFLKIVEVLINDK